MLESSLWGGYSAGRRLDMASTSAYLFPPIPCLVMEQARSLGGLRQPGGCRYLDTQLHVTWRVFLCNAFLVLSIFETAFPAPEQRMHLAILHFNPPLDKLILKQQRRDGVGQVDLSSRRKWWRSYFGRLDLKQSEWGDSATKMEPFFVFCLLFLSDPYRTELQG